jgi:all-trans-8'-apo-beta-carotenal 15,15'-oxygenase
MNRRHLLASLSGLSLAGIITPELARAAGQWERAAASGVDWRLGFADLEADAPPAAMRLVSGRPPAGLAGALYRNGSGKLHRPGGSADHWFDGDGLIRAFRIGDGGATLAARFIDTPKRRADAAANAVVTPGFGTSAGAGARISNNDDTNAANISVLPVGGELWALWEAGSPTVIDPADLSTRGMKTLRPDLAHMPFLAHPHAEPGGDIWNLGLAGDKAVVWRLGQDGILKSADTIDLPRASYIHDFTATRRHLILVLQPWIQDHADLPYTANFSWRPAEGTKVLVLDKADLGRRRVYDLPAFFAFHYGAAWEEADGTLRFDVCASANPTFVTHTAQDLVRGVLTPAPDPILTLITLLPDGGARLEATGVVAEFPRIDSRLAGSTRRHTLHATGSSASPLFHGVATHDWNTGRSDAFDFGPAHLVEEAVFTPRPGGETELDGWLLVPSVNLAALASELHVFNASRVADGPVCVWRAGVCLPVGLHGAFVAA